MKEYYFHALRKVHVRFFENRVRDKEKMPVKMSDFQTLIREQMAVHIPAFRVRCVLKMKLSGAKFGSGLIQKV